MGHLTTSMWCCQLGHNNTSVANLAMCVTQTWLWSTVLGKLKEQPAQNLLRATRWGHHTIAVVLLCVPPCERCYCSRALAHVCIHTTRPGKGTHTHTRFAEQGGLSRCDGHTWSCTQVSSICQHNRPQNVAATCKQCSGSVQTASLAQTAQRPCLVTQVLDQTTGMHTP